jgi:chromosome segregation ATPase|tara:strand:+ start:613 stop:1266 length:654 start_codon:yes stop_codon:yes gene_type:complete
MDRNLKIEKRSPSYLKKSNRGGLLIGFIYVIAFMSILLLAIWQTFESESNKTNNALIDERLSLIEEQINLADETNNDSITDISSSIQFLDKEVRKLWDLSNKRNKVNIQKLTKQNSEIEKLLLTLEKDIKKSKDNINQIKETVDSNITQLDELKLTKDEIVSIQLNLNNANTQLILLEDSVQALNNYKNQINQAILEIQTDISKIKSISNQGSAIQN